MTFQHHGEGEGERSEALRKLFADQQAAFQRFQDQVNGRAKRAYPFGRLCAEDEGELAFAISGDPKTETVMVDFGKPVAFIGMTPQQAIELAQHLIRVARSTSKSPVSIVLH